MKKVPIYSDFINLGQFLKLEKIISSGSHAKPFLNLNKVTVNGVAEKRRGRKIYPKDNVCIHGEEYVVIRKGE